MKKLLTNLLSFVAIAMIVSCVNEQTEPQGQLVSKTFVGYLDETQESDTRTTLDENDFSIKWSSSDHITVFDGDGVGKSFTEVTVDATGKTASFKGEIKLSDAYHAVYPLQDDATYVSDGGKITATLPTVQTAVAGTFADGMNLAVAKSSGENLYFKNVGALLSVKCPTSNANTIRIVSRDPEVKMTGVASITYNNGNPVATVSSSAVNYVEVTCNTTAVNDIYYFVVYPGTYTQGFDIVFTSKNDPAIKSKITSTKELRLDRNSNVMLFNSPSGYSFGWNSPAEPSSVSAELAGVSGLAGVNVSWKCKTNSGYASGFNIYAREEGISGNGTLQKTINDVGKLTCTVDGLAQGKSYEFGVQTVSKYGESKNSEIVWSDPIPLPTVDNCLKPTNITLEQIDDASVKLTWKDNSAAEFMYRVYKDDGSAVNTADLAPDTEEYTFKGLALGSTYKFAVEARGAYNNHSGYDYKSIKVLTWAELQDYDAGDNECLAPREITYIQDTDNVVVFNWDCWSSARTGFNLYARPASASAFTKEHFVEEVGKDDKTYMFTGLTTATEYVFGIQTKGSDVYRNSDIIEVPVTVKNFAWPYPFESGRSIPTFSNLALCYGGNCERVPQYWTVERFKPTVTYTDKNGQEHWLFESMLMLELWSNWNAASYALTANGENSSKREHWQQQLDYWFDDTYGFAALDQCIEEAKGRLGEPKKKHLVIFSLPDPVYFENFKNKTNTIYWGSIAGTTMDFKNLDHRVDAYKWMINQIRARFNAKGYKNIELAGFYILNESLSVTSSSYNYQYKEHDKIIKRVTEYCHGFNEGVFWIPYNCAEGYTSWKSLGIDCTIMQPNKYWPNETTKTWNDVLTAVKNYDMGIELEFEGTHGEAINSSILTYKKDGSKNTYAATNKGYFETYLTKIKAELTLYGKKPIALYTGTNALYELATSTDEQDNALYHKLGDFLINAKY